MKILQVIRSIDPADGGTVEAVRQFGVGLAAAGHQVEAASVDPPDAPWVAAFPFPVHALGPGRLNYGYNSRLGEWLRAEVTNYDAVIVNGLWQYHGFATWRALHDSPIPYVVYTHGMLDPWFKRTYPLKHLKKWAYWPWAEYRVLRDARAVIFTCDEERLLARKSFWLYRAHEAVVAYGISAPTGDPATQRALFLNSFPAVRGKRIVISMGRLHPKKGCDIALAAFSKTFAQDPDWHLVMAGPDQVGWEADLKTMALKLNIADRITWTGMLHGDLKWGALRSSEIFLLPSHQENFGIVVAEAFACGLPALVSDRVNLWREVLDSGGGLVGSDDLPGTIALLKSWQAMSPLERSQMCQRAREYFAQHFHIQRASANLLNVLTTVVARTPVKAMSAGALNC